MTNIVRAQSIGRSLCPRLVNCLLSFVMGCTTIGHADADPNEIVSMGREVPSRIIPVPRDVSPELQDMIHHAKAASPEWTVPRTLDEWRASIAKVEQLSQQVHEARVVLEKAFPVVVELGRIAGIPAYTIAPPVIPRKNRHRALMYVHGGGYVSGGGETGLTEAILLAHYTGMKIIALEYRLPPDHPFPAAIEDAVAVWREILRTVKAVNVGLAGSSAGGGLVLAIVMKLKELKLPLPGALYTGTPWADLTNGGDSVATNDGIDSGLSGSKEWLLAAGRLYAGTHDVRDPLISPLFGNFSKFPPTILLTGTRDFFLSDTVRVHRKLRAAGIEADLHVFEAMSHGEYANLWKCPESREAYREVAAFLDRHLGIAL